MMRTSKVRWITVALATVFVELAIERDALAQDPNLEPAPSEAPAMAQPPAPPASVEPPASVTPAATLIVPNAGYHGSFYIRDSEEYFRLYVQGRVHVDNVTSFGPGLDKLSPDQALKSTFSIRRARLELGGEILQNRFQWGLSGEFGPTSVDNVAARNAASDCTVDATTGAQACTTRTNPVEAPSQRPVATDAWVNWAAAPWFNVQGGQFLLPFMLENRLSENQTPFLERALAVRLVGAPNTRDIGAMVWGEAEDTLVYYSLGIFNGDGPNRPNADSRYDLAGRAFTRPLAKHKNQLLSDLQVGASARYGSRDRAYVGYDVPTLTTQGGYAFWRPTYRDSGNRLVHILPSGDQTAVAAELFLPLGVIDMTSEVVYSRSDTREALDGYQLSPFTERMGVLKGLGYYVEASVWVIGDRSIVGFPSYSKPQHLDLTKPHPTPKQGLQLLAKLEQLALTYESASRSGTADKSSPDGDINVTAITLGATYWATRHFRLSLNYIHNEFPDSAPVSASVKDGPLQTSTQRAIAPAQNLAEGQDDSARSNAHSLNEVHFRLGVQF